MGLNAGAAVAESTTATRSSERRKASASVQPTGPAPRMSTSTAGASIARQRFDVLRPLGRFGGDHLAAARRHHHIVLDAHTDVAQRLGHIVGAADVTPG